MIAFFAAAGVVLALALTMVRLFAGPTHYDRSLAALSVIWKAALVCAAIGAAEGAVAWIDVALALGACALVLSVALLKFFRARSFQPPLVRTSGDEA